MSSSDLSTTFGTSGAASLAGKLGKRPGAAPAPPTPTSAAPAPATAKTRDLGRPISTVAPNPLNPRTIDPNDEQYRELRDSLEEVGQIEPCAVVTAAAFLAIYPEYRATVGTAHEVQVTGGVRRAMLIAIGETKIDAVVKDQLARDRSTFFEATMAENVHRNSLDPIDTARGLETLRAELKKAGKEYTNDAIGRRMQKTAMWVSHHNNLLKLHPDIQAALRVRDKDRKLHMRTVRDWHMREHADQLVMFRQWQISNGLVEADPATPTPDPAPRRPQRAPRSLPLVATWRKLGDPQEEAKRLRATLPAADIDAMVRDYSALIEALRSTPS